MECRRDIECVRLAERLVAPSDLRRIVSLVVRVEIKGSNHPIPTSTQDIRAHLRRKHVDTPVTRWTRVLHTKTTWTASVLEVADIFWMDACTASIRTFSDSRYGVIHLKRMVAYNGDDPDHGHRKRQLGKVHQVILLLTLHCSRDSISRDSKTRFRKLTLCNATQEVLMGQPRCTLP